MVVEKAPEISTTGKLLTSIPVILACIIISLTVINSYYYQFLSLQQLVVASAILTGVSFTLTVTIISPGLKVVKSEGEKKKAGEETSAILVGIGGIYGIIMGIGVSSALEEYVKAASIRISNALSSNPIGLFAAVIALDLPNTFRLVGFLVTIIPFIHGAILTFTHKWYHIPADPNDKSKPARDRYDLAFVFFIMVFIHSMLFFFVALNITNASVYVLILWVLMGLNSVWIPIQGHITSTQLERRDLFLTEWTLLNFNTFAFLFVFIFASPSLSNTGQSIGNDLWVNLVILIILFGRSVADYKIAWKDLYSKPQ